STSSKCLSNRMRLIIAIVSGVTTFLSLLALSIALTMMWKAKGRSSVFRATVMPTTTRPTFLIRQPDSVISLHFAAPHLQHDPYIRK
ncbi:unnamed protein product, partial [Didymodactylos carnosus]